MNGESISGKNEQNSVSKVNETTVKPKRKRLFYLDFIRALSVFLIVLTHFNNPYFAGGGWLLFNNPFNIFVGNLGVSLFLIISASALTVTYGKRMNLRHYFYRRFMGIYPMFWIAYIVGAFTLFALHLGPLANGQPKWSVIFSILGVDGMVANLGLPNMYLLGEWFLGFIVIFYFFFPIMLWGVQRFPWITAIVGVAIWGGFLFWWYSGTHYVAPAIFLPVRIIELFFGIYMAQYWKKLPVWAVVPALGILIASSLLPQIPEDVATTFVGIAAFVILAVLAEFLDRQPIRKVIAWVSKYSYAIFLVHHVIIMVMFSLSPITTYGTAAKYFAFGNICVLTGVCGYVLFHVHRYVMKGVFAGIAKVGGTKAK